MCRERYFMRAKRAGAVVAALVVVAAGMVATPAVAAGGPISGVVWHDYDANGVRDPAFEEALAGVNVVATDSAGNSLATTTAADGSYTINAPSGAQRWRVEAWLPDGKDWTSFRPSVVGSGTGTSNGTSVQFVSVGSTEAGTVDFSFQAPAAYTPTNPFVYLADDSVRRA